MTKTIILRPAEPERDFGQCAITRFEGNESANTLHIGVDRPYRGRKLGQAVQMLVLRYARNVLKAHSVRTTHTAENLPALAIDRKLGLCPGGWNQPDGEGVPINCG